ncbi:MAG TPA: hypothetical protein VLH13_04355, partial [Methanomassiliicoccales archaeon]|nr:hypothetical protein [Methanomassiliicoccales archaeon]
FIFGAPSEGAEDVNDSIEFARRNRPHGVQFNILDCLVGTDIWEEMRKKGFVGEGDWVTNHRIYEYYMDGPGKDRLQALVDQAYATWLDGWKNISGIIELLRLLVNNGTARKVVLHNIMNPAVSRGIKNGLSMYGG